MRVVIFFCLLFTVQFSWATRLPQKYKQRLESHNLKGKNLFFFWRPTECISCISLELTTALELSKSTGKVYFLFENESSELNLAAILKSGEYNIPPSAFITDKFLFGMISFKNNLVLIDDSNYKVLKSDSSPSGILKELENTLQVSVREFYSVDLPLRSKGLYYDVQILGGKAYCFSYQLGHIITKNGSQSIDTIDLHSKLDKAAIFDMLDLNKVDSLLTVEGTLDSKMYGSRFIDLMAYNRSFLQETNCHYFTASVNFNHRFSEDELEVMLPAWKKSGLGSGIKKGDDVETIRNVFLLLKFDDEFNLLSISKLNDKLGDHSLQFHSPLVISENSIFGGTGFYVLEKNKSFADSNSVFMELYQDKNRQFYPKEISAVKKPQWFTDTGLFNDFSGCFPMLIGEQLWFQMDGYPCLINIQTQQKLEVPKAIAGDLLKTEKLRFNKKNDSYFSTLGTLENGETKGIVYRLNPVKKTYYASFSSEGKYLSNQEIDFGFEKDAVYYIYNGELVQVRQDQMTFYEVTYR